MLTSGHERISARSSQLSQEPSTSCTSEGKRYPKVKPVLPSARLLPFALAFLVLLTSQKVPAEQHLAAWEPAPGQKQIPIWPGTPPDAVVYDGPEYSQLAEEKHELVAGKPWLSAERVSVPTMTVYAPKGRNTGAAVVVFPGGGYQVLAMDLEGTEVCDWLTAEGVTCILLKYRVPGSDKLPKSGAYPQPPQALEDAQRTIGLVRFHAADWHIDPHKIGVIGFSAGGHLVAATSVHFDKRLYPLVDEADETSCRPDFALAIYPGHLAAGENNFALTSDIATHLSKATPPTFILQNEDDDVDGVKQALSYYIGLKKAGVPVEMHLYAQGGHAFGLRRTALPVTDWPLLANIWLQTINVLPK
jgi:acetyl esterase/lipase